MDMLIDFPGGRRVDTRFGAFTVTTDQGETRSVPTPFELFLASLATCAGYYVLGFCLKRNLPTEGLRMVQRVHSHPVTDVVETIEIDIEVPPDFPEMYLDALVKSAEACKVKKHMEKPPAFVVRARQAVR